VIPYSPLNPRPVPTLSTCSGRPKNPFLNLSPIEGVPPHRFLTIFSPLLNFLVWRRVVPPNVGRTLSSSSSYYLQIIFSHYLEITDFETEWRFFFQPSDPPGRTRRWWLHESLPPSSLDHDFCSKTLWVALTDSVSGFRISS